MWNRPLPGLEIGRIHRDARRLGYTLQPDMTDDSHRIHEAAAEE
jgi:hypothetical protein